MEDRKVLAILPPPCCHNVYVFLWDGLMVDLLTSKYIYSNVAATGRKGRKWEGRGEKGKGGFISNLCTPRSAKHFIDHQRSMWLGSKISQAQGKNAASADSPGGHPWDSLMLAFIDELSKPATCYAARKQTVQGENQVYKECMKGHFYIIVLPNKWRREGGKKCSPKNWKWTFQMVGWRIIFSFFFWFSVFSILKICFKIYLSLFFPLQNQHPGQKLHALPSSSFQTDPAVPGGLCWPS